MPHFPPYAGRLFPVEMQFDTRHSQRSSPIGFAVLPEIAQQIGHRGRPQQLGGTERQPANGPRLLLELAGHRRVDGEMTRVVGPRGQFVDEQPAPPVQKELHTEHADHIQLGQHRARQLDGFSCNRRRHGCRRHGEIQDVVAMAVFDDAPVGKSPVQPTRGDHRQLPVEVDHRLQDSFLLADGRPGSRRVLRAVDARLAFAVVAKGRSLEDGRAADLGQRGSQRLSACGRRQRG